MSACLLILVTLTCSGVFALVNAAPSVVISNIAPISGGLQGGTLLTINGVGFMRDGNDGITSVALANFPCEIVHYYMTDTTIVCRTPAVPFSYNYGRFTVQVNVAGTGYGTSSTCVHSGRCQFLYSENITPRITSVNARNLVAGSIFPLTGSVLGTSLSQRDIRINGNACSVDFEGDVLYPTPVEPLSATSASCKVNDQPAGYYDISMSVSPYTPREENGYGDAMLGDLHVYNDRGQKYVVVQFPLISAVTPQTGSTMGGGLVTISGSSFDTNCNKISVRLAGVNARVIKCSVNEIVVSPSANSDYRTRNQTATFGTVNYKYSPSGAGSIVNNAFVTVSGLTSTILDSGASSSLNTLFVAPFTANYQFFVTAYTSVEFSLYTDGSRKTLLASTPSTRWRPLWDSDGLRTSSVQLEKGKVYYTKVAWVGGSMAVSVKITNITSDTSSLADVTENSGAFMAPTVTKISFNLPNIVREKQELTIIGANSGSFMLTAPGAPTLYSVPISLSLSGDVRNLIQSFASNVSRCFDIGVTTTSADAANLYKGVTYTIEWRCPSTTRPLISISNVNLVSAGNSQYPLQMTGTRTATPTTPIGGQVRFGYGKQNTSWPQQSVIS